MQGDAHDLEFKRQHKNEQRRKKKEERKMRGEPCLEQEPAETARETESMIIISQNNRILLQTKAKRHKPIHNHKRGYDPVINK
jgi:hypothetical protein